MSFYVQEREGAHVMSSDSDDVLVKILYSLGFLSNKSTQGFVYYHYLDLNSYTCIRNNDLGFTLQKQTDIESWEVMQPHEIEISVQ